jgi:hypothetical protein
MCWDDNAGNIEVKRKKKSTADAPAPQRAKSGRLIALSFWVED